MLTEPVVEATRHFMTCSRPLTSFLWWFLHGNHLFRLLSIVLILSCLLHHKPHAYLLWLHHFYGGPRLLWLVTPSTSGWFYCVFNDNTYRSHFMTLCWCYFGTNHPLCCLLNVGHTSWLFHQKLLLNFSSFLYSFFFCLYGDYAVLLVELGIDFIVELFKG